LGVQFKNENFFRWARPHKGLRRGVQIVRRSRKPAQNAAQREKDHLWMDTSLLASINDIYRKCQSVLSSFSPLTTATVFDEDIRCFHPTTGLDRMLHQQIVVRIDREKTSLIAGFLNPPVAGYLKRNSIAGVLSSLPLN